MSRWVSLYQARAEAAADSAGVSRERGGDVRDGVRPGSVLRPPLVGAGGALEQLPLVAEQDLEEAVVPRHGGVGPDALKAAGDRVGALAGAEGVPPAEALRLDRGGLGVGADVVRGARAMGLAEGVTARDQGHRRLVVHR